MPKYDIYKHLQTRVALIPKVKIKLLPKETSHPLKVTT